MIELGEWRVIVRVDEIPNEESVEEIEMNVEGMLLSLARLLTNGFPSRHGMSAEVEVSLYNPPPK